ncbi:MAG: CoA pyrophosphatase [Actinobacteria bacterium]|nr:CoA pyrophosphatase [Actinomycetota bacterium]
MASFERVGVEPDGLRHAAVAVTIMRNEKDEACFLITRRPASMRRHAGQWALPGGRLDAGETPVIAAIREIREEVGLAVQETEIVGTLDDYPTRSGFLITPIVVWSEEPAEFVLDPAEVESAHLVPLVELEREEVPRFIDGADPERPVIQVPLYGHFVHAPTAAILYQFREIAMYGRPTRVAHYDQPPFAWQ